MRNPLRTAVAVLAVTMLTAVAGCSGDEARDGGNARGRPQATDAGLSGDPEARPAVAYDPEPAHVISVGPMEKPPVTLHGRAVWIADEAGLTAYDVTTGKTVNRIEPENRALYQAPSPERMSEMEGETLQYRVLPPQVAVVKGEPVVLATIPVELETSTGGVPQTGFEVIAVGADDAKVRWRLPVDLYGEWDGRLGAAVWRPPHNGMAAVQWTLDDGLAGTFVVDLNQRRVLWQRSDFLVVDGYQDALVGFRENQDGTWSTGGAGLADGRDLWNTLPSDGEITVGGRYDDGYAAGPWTLAKADGRDPQLMDIATGDLALSEQSGLTGDMVCSMRQGGSAVLCSSEIDGALALDAKTGELLWQRPAGDGPDTWSGTVSTLTKDYAYVDRADGPIVIDVRTGKVVGETPGIVADRANAYAGLVFTGTDVEIHLPRGTAAGRS